MQIHGDLTVAVRAPMRMPKAQIDRFVEQHESWIAKHLAQMRKNAEARKAFTCSDGESFPYRGGELTISLHEGRAVRRMGEWLLLPREADRPAALAEFLREEARRLTAERIAHFAPLLGVTPAGVKITSAKTRWGSCSGRNSLCFTYRVACLPDELLDYIVVHELSHIREHNHSARFWAVVASVLPDYARRRAALREFQKKIVF